MRVIEVEDEASGERWLLWTLAGAALGLTAGVLLAEKYSGRSPDARQFLRRARGLVSKVASQWGPLVEAALEARDAFAGGSGRAPVADDLIDDDWDEEDLDDAPAAGARATLDDDDDRADDDGESEDEIGARVLEAFLNDPVLAERAVEIESDDDGEVLLTGTVRKAREVAHAVTIARGVPGVTRVRQRLAVR